MMVQEEIIFQDYYRVYCLGKKYVHIMPYEPRNPHHLRYATTHQTQGEELNKLLKTIEDNLAAELISAVMEKFHECEAT